MLLFFFILEEYENVNENYQKVETCRIFSLGNLSSRQILIFQGKDIIRRPFITCLITFYSNVKVESNDFVILFNVRACF